MSQKRLPKVQLTQIVSTPPPDESKPVVVTTTGDLSYVDSLGGGGFFLHQITAPEDKKYLVLSGSSQEYAGDLQNAILDDATALLFASSPYFDTFDDLRICLTPIIKDVGIVYYFVSVAPSVQTSEIEVGIEIVNDEVVAL